MQRTRPSRKPQPGDKICGDCGESNPNNRKFCSRCGNSLETAEVVKTSWWKKLIGIFKRKPKVLPAGERYGRGGQADKKKFSLMKIYRPIRLVLSIILILGGLLYSVYAPFRTAVNDRVASAKDRVNRIIKPQFDPVSATGVNGTSGLPEHEPGKAIDGFKNTAWVTPGADGQPILILTFAEPVDLDRMIVFSGDGANFQANNRPEKLHFVFSNGKAFDATLKDTPEKQEVGIKNGGKINSVEIHVTSMFKSVSGTDMAISEIELFTKK